MNGKIIGISGISGAGKTTLAKALSKTLQATCLVWDDFDEISTGPKDYLDWYKRGQNYEEWDYEALASILSLLRDNVEVEHPTLQIKLVATEYIIIEAPLGRLHKQTGQYMDYIIHIDTPLDVALARRLIRDCKSENFKDHLVEELQSYLKHTRKLFFDDNLRKKADLVVSGLDNPKKQIKEVCAFLHHRKKRTALPS